MRGEGLGFASAFYDLDDALTRCDVKPSNVACSGRYPELRREPRVSLAASHPARLPQRIECILCLLASLTRRRVGQCA